MSRVLLVLIVSPFAIIMSGGLWMAPNWSGGAPQITVGVKSFLGQGARSIDRTIGKSIQDPLVRGLLDKAIALEPARAEKVRVVKPLYVMEGQGASGRIANSASSHEEGFLATSDNFERPSPSQRAQEAAEWSKPAIDRQ